MNILEAFDQLNIITEGVSKYQSRSLNLFETGETNVLLITGISGSGKSSLAKELAEKYDAKIISLDDGWLGGITLGNPPDDKPFKEYWFSKEFWKEFPKHKDEFNACLDFCKQSDYEYIAELFRESNNKEKNSYYNDYITYAFEYPKRRPNTRFIIEGVQLMDYSKATGFVWKKQIEEVKAIIFMTTSIADTVDNVIERDKEWGEMPQTKKAARSEIKNWKVNFDKFYKEFH